MRFTININRLIPNLFFLFFVAQILSPKIGGRSIYLEVFIAFLDSNFRTWVFRNLKKNSAVFLVVALLPVALWQVAVSFKLICTTITVGYLLYAWQNNVFYLKRFFTLSVAMAVLQFVLMYVNPTLGMKLGPHNISVTLWGVDNSMGNTNFYASITDFVRVSGLSREAGFFASLLVAIMLLTFIESRNGRKNSKMWIFILLVAYFVSFSKMSLIIFPLLLIVFFNKQINFFPSFLVVSLFFITMVLIWYHSEYLLIKQNESFLQRFGAYAIFLDLNNISTLLLGKESLNAVDFDGYYSLRFWNASKYDFLAGLSGSIVQYGLVMVIILLLFVSHLGITSTGFLVLLFLTINVDLFTNQNFVSLAYFIVIKFFSTKRSVVKCNHKLLLSC